MTYFLTINYTIIDWINNKSTDFIQMATNKGEILHSNNNPIQKQLIPVKKSVRLSKAELTVTKSNDIIMRPCARCASCKIILANQIIQCYCKSVNENYVMLLVFKCVSIFINATQI